MATPRKALAIKVSEAEAEGLKRIAESTNQTVTAVLLGGARAHAELAAARAELRALQQRYEAATGRKPDLRMRVSVPLSRAEYAALSEAADAARVSRPQYLRGIMARRQELPALEAA